MKPLAGAQPAGAVPGRSLAVRSVLACCAIAVFAGTMALGTWQVQRLFWKLDLIARVEQRVHAVPVPAPAPFQVSAPVTAPAPFQASAPVPGPALAPNTTRWPSVTAANDEYRHVIVAGIFLPEHSVRVQAVTDLGPGFWLMTPLRQANGALVLINRGFVLARQSGLESTTPKQDAGVCDRAAPAATVPSTVTGLLRISEPGGAFLRHNDAAAGRWYSRDVAAIAAQQGIGPVAPYFIDADADAGQANRQPSSDCPLGGLTVVSFHNNHLVYALTWYALAAMMAGAFGWQWYERRRRSKTHPA